jgi:hypothetical protein
VLPGGSSAFFYESEPYAAPWLTRTQLGPNHAFLSVLIRKHRLDRRGRKPWIIRIQSDHPSAPGDGGGSENPGVGGSIPSQPTILLNYLPIREFPPI